MATLIRSSSIPPAPESQSIRCMLWPRLTRAILVVARAMPTMQMNRPIGAFCRAKTCGTARAERPLIRGHCPGNMARHGLPFGWNVHAPL